MTIPGIDLLNLKALPVHTTKKIFVLIAIAIVAIAILLYPLQSVAQQSDRSLVLMHPGSNPNGTPWSKIPVDSMAWLLRCTYEIDPRSAGNLIFRNPSLANLICEDIRAGRIRAFGTETDSFTSALNRNEVFAITDKASALAGRGNFFMIRIIEDLVSIKNTGKLHRAIIAIAPEMMDSNGVWKPAFWVYFQELKPHLASVTANKKNAETWLTIFDSGNYNSRLISSADTIRYFNIVDSPASQLK